MAAYKHRIGQPDPSAVVADVEEKEIEDAAVPLAAAPDADDTETPEDTVSIPDTEIPLAAEPVVSQPAGEAAPAANAAAVETELTELNSVLDLMLAEPTAVTGTTVAATTAASDEGGTTASVNTSQELSAAAEEAARKAAEEAAKKAAEEAAKKAAEEEAKKAAEEAARKAAEEAAKKAEEAKEREAKAQALREKIDALKQQLAEQKTNTAQLQEALNTAQNRYTEAVKSAETALNVANQSLAAAQDKALALYNMKFAGMAALSEQITQNGKTEGQTQSKINEYFATRTQRPDVSLDSQGGNWGKPITETGTLTGKVTGQETKNNQGDDTNGDGGLNAQVKVDLGEAQTPGKTQMTLAEAKQEGINAEWGIYQIDGSNPKTYDIMWSEDTFVIGSDAKLFYYDASNKTLYEVSTTVTEKKDANGIPTIQPGQIDFSNAKVIGTAIESAADITGLMAGTYDDKTMSEYNAASVQQAQTAVDAAQAVVNQETGTPTGTAQEALDAAKAEEAKAIAEEKKVEDTLNSTMNELTALENTAEPQTIQEPQTTAEPQTTPEPQTISEPQTTAPAVSE